MMADASALQGQPSHLANGSRGRSHILPYQPHGFKISAKECTEPESSATELRSNDIHMLRLAHVYLKSLSNLAVCATLSMHLQCQWSGRAIVIWCRSTNKLNCLRAPMW